jgi:hypothetical protein
MNNQKPSQLVGVKQICARTLFRQLYSVTLLLIVAFVVSLTAPPRVTKAQTQALSVSDRLIQRDGFLPGGREYLKRAREKYGRLKPHAANFIARSASPCNQIIEVGNQPEGFGKGFNWCRKEEEILLVTFINPADDQGIYVTGLQPGDRIRITSAAGLASFSKATGNSTASSLVGLIAIGAKAGLGLAGVPEAIPLVNSAEAFAIDQFKGTGEATKWRDPFGVEPDTGHKAKQEGGIVVCLPEAGGLYYSGNEDHEERWIKEPGDRIDANRPAHVIHGFYPIQGNASHNTRTIRTSGESPLYVMAWDHKFGDNAGYYKVFIHIKKGTPPPPPSLGKKL